MHRKLLVLLFAAVLFFSGCAARQMVKFEQTDVATAQSQSMKQTGSTPQVDRSIIKSGIIVVEVEEVKATAKKAEDIVLAAKGIIMYGNEDENGYYMTAKVPPDKLEFLLESIGSIGHEIKRNITKTDVTDQISDQVAVIENKKVLRDRLRYLVSKNNDMREVIDMENEIVRLQSEIDSLESRLRNMRADVAMSSLSVTLNKKRAMGPVTWIFYGLYWVIEKLFVW